MRFFTRNRPPVRLEPATPDEYREILQELADEYPWFGMPPFDPTLRKNPPPRGFLDPEYLRRVLLSFLVGRPISEIARRAGCSSRLVYAIVRAQIYDSEDEGALEAWAELGLIGLVDGPCVPDTRAWDIALMDSEFEIYADETVLVCLICHRIVGRICLEVEKRHFDGQLVSPGDPAWDPGHGVIGPLRGHLICHFFLGDDPIRPREPEPLDELAALGRAEIAEAAQRRLDTFERVLDRSHWWSAANPEALHVVMEWEDQGSRALLPIVGGRPIRLEAARRWWASMLDGAAAGPRVDRQGAG